MQPRNNVPLPCTRAKPAPSSGDISGATSIAPMTAAGELFSRPKAASAVDSPIMMVKSTFCKETVPFAEGWLVEETGEYLGRPVDVVQYIDGSILVSDDLVGAIYRISYVGG